MDTNLNQPVKGVLIEEVNETRRNNEKKTYYSFWLEADNCLEYLFDFPRTALYRFTENEYIRNIKRQTNTADRSLFTVGVLNLFCLGKPTVVVKLTFEGFESVVKIPIHVLRHALARGSRKKEDKKPGLINRVASKIVEVFK